MCVSSAFMILLGLFDWSIGWVDGMRGEHCHVNQCCLQSFGLSFVFDCVARVGPNRNQSLFRLQLVCFIHTCVVRVSSRLCLFSVSPCCGLIDVVFIRRSGSGSTGDQEIVGSFGPTDDLLHCVVRPRGLLTSQFAELAQASCTAAPSASRCSTEAGSSKQWRQKGLN